VVTALLGTTDVLNNLNSEAVVQERVSGTEYAVDTFSFDGSHATTNICRYAKLDDGARFAVYESMTFVPYEAPGNAALLEYARQALDTLGIRFGFAHSEIMMTPDGPQLVEVGARLPGAGLPSACTVATGENGIDRLIGYLRGDEVRLDYTLERPVRVVYFIAPRSGFIGNTEAYRRVARLRSCRHLRLNVCDGDRVPVTTDLLSTMAIGWALLAHRDPGQVDRDHAAVRALERQVEYQDEPPGGDR